MKNYFSIIFIISALLFSCAGTNSSTEISTSLDPKQFAALADSLNDENILDVRTAKEFADGHLEGALNFDWNGADFANETANLDKSKPVLVYCLSGGRSAQAAAYLRKNGFSSVYEMNHGILGWKAEHLPLTSVAVKTADVEQAPGIVTPEAFNALLKSKSIVLVDFGATWCGPCRMLAPRLDALEKEMGEKFRLVKLDADRDIQLATMMNITALPTLILYKDEKVIWRSEGLIEKSVIAEQIKLAEKK